MDKPILKPSREYLPADVGTLWTMRRRDRRARCALLSGPRGLELRVLVDGRPLLSETVGVRTKPLPWPNDGGVACWRRAGTRSFQAMLARRSQTSANCSNGRHPGVLLVPSRVTTVTTL